MPDKVYLDASGNPVKGTGTRLDEQGRPIVNASAVGGDTINGQDPNAPPVSKQILDALGHAAQPEGVADFLSLLIPSGAGEAVSGIKDMARLLTKATKESPTLKGILPQIVKTLQERPKTLQDFQAEGFNALPLAQQMEHLPPVAAPERAMGAPPPMIRPPVSPATETAAAAPVPASAAPPAPPVTPPSAAVSDLSADEQQALEALVKQGYPEADVRAEIAKSRPSVNPTPKPILNAAEMKEYLRLTRSGKSHADAMQLIDAQRQMTQRLQTPSSETVRRAVVDRNATGRWDQ